MEGFLSRAKNDRYDKIVIVHSGNLSSTFQEGFRTILYFGLVGFLGTEPFFVDQIRFWRDIDHVTGRKKATSASRRKRQPVLLQLSGTPSHKEMRRMIQIWRNFIEAEIAAEHQRSNIRTLGQEIARSLET